MVLSSQAALVLIPVFAISDRWVGWGGNGRVKPMLFAILAGGTVGYLTLGTPFFILGALWAAWRSVGFFHNSLAPATSSDRMATVIRYSLQIPIAILAYWAHGPWYLLIGTLAVCAAIGVTLRFIFGHVVAEVRGAGGALEGDFNALIEITTGAAFGAALAAYGLLK